MNDSTPRPDGGEADDDTDHPANTSKVARLIDEYELEGAGQTLTQRWQGESGERYSLRDLADRFNQWLLRAEMEAAGIDYLDGEVENLYRLLTDAEVSSGKQTQARGRLERDGVDVDRLHRDFVSHQAMHTYLTKHRGVSPPTEPDHEVDRVQQGRETVQRLRNRLQAVVNRTLADLRSSDHLELGDFDVLIEVNVLCNDCGRYYGISELLDAGSCDCPGGNP